MPLIRPVRSHAAKVGMQVAWLIINRESCAMSHVSGVPTGDILRPVRSVLAAIVLFLFPALFSTLAQPQSLPNLALTRLNYTVTKRRVNPQGELKAKIDAVDSELATATQQGKIGEVRRLVAKGLTARQIATRLVISHRTVENHVQSTLRKLQLHNRVELARYAIEHGLDAEESS